VSRVIVWEYRFNASTADADCRNVISASPQDV
jgi:hypothetical protein